MVGVKSRNNLAIIGQLKVLELGCKFKQNDSSFDVGKWFDDFLYFVDIVCSILDTADFAFYVQGARRPSVLDERPQRV